MRPTVPPRLQPMDDDPLGARRRVCRGHRPRQLQEDAGEQRHKIRVLFQHCRDPLIGEKPLGRITHLAEDERGAAYEVELLDTEYVRELIPALEAGLYGASFRFRPLRQEVNESPRASNYNP